MQNYGQFRVRIHIRNQVQFRFAMRQWWPHVVAVLRTGCIKTTGHPFQVAAEQPIGFIGFSRFRLPVGNLPNYAREASK